MGFTPLQYSTRNVTLSDSNLNKTMKLDQRVIPTVHV